jgi:hypothetical protein
VPSSARTLWETLSATESRDADLMPSTPSVAAAICAVVIANFAGPAISSATVRDCTAPSPNPGQGPRDDRYVPFGKVKTRGVSCGAALAAIRNGHMNPRFHTAGFSCTVVRQYQAGHGGPVLGQDIRCAPGSGKFWWSWAT